MRALISLMILAAASACTVEAPWLGQAGALCRPNGTCDDGLVCNAGFCDGGCVLDTPLEIEPLPQRTIHDRVVVRGEVGKEADEIVITTVDTAERLPAAGGAFCQEIPLREGQKTKISVVARDRDGCVTAPRLFDVTHSPNGANVVAGLLPRGPWPRVESLTDGSVSTTMQFSFTDDRDPEGTEICDTYTYLWFTLEQKRELNRLVVKYPDREDFGRYILCWSLLYSNAEDPGTPLPARSDAWAVVGQSTQGSASELVYDFPKTIEARHIALLVFEDGEPGKTENFELAEVEFYSPPEEEPFSGCP